MKIGNETSVFFKKKNSRKRESIYFRGIVEIFGIWMEVEVVYWGYLGFFLVIVG